MRFRRFLFRDPEQHLPKRFDVLGAAFRLQFQAPVDRLQKLRAKLLSGQRSGRRHGMPQTAGEDIDGVTAGDDVIENSGQ